MPTPREVLERLKRVPYPGFTRDIVSFGMVKDVEVSSNAVTVHLVPSTAQEDVLTKIEADVRAAVAEMPEVPRVEIVRAEAPRAAAPRGRQPIPGIRNVLAVASGKGGV